MSLADFVHDALAPLRGPPAWLVLVVTPLYWLAGMAGMVGIPLLAVLGGWVWTYTFLMIEATAHGLPPPVLSIEKTSPWHEPRALFPLLVALIVGWAMARLGGNASPAAIVALVALAVILMPASFAVLSIEDGIARALWPPALLRVVVGLGPRYLALLALGAVYAVLLAVLARHLPVILMAALAQFALFSCAAALGRSLYRRRDALALEAWQAPERDEQRAALAAGRRAETVATEIYGLLRAKQGAEAAARADAWLATEGASPDACRWLRDRALEWDEQRLANRLDGALLSRLVALRRLGEALAVLEGCWQRGGTPALTPAEVDALLAVAERAGQDDAVARLHTMRSHPASD